MAADVDPAVSCHPASHQQVVLEAGALLRFAVGFFDLIVSDWTFEHIEEPEQVASELLRVLRPGGVICARTSNRYGYVKLAASAVPNKLHTTVLRSIQPDREHKDVFPTVYKMGSVRQIRALFPGCEVSWYRDNSEPAYYVGSPRLYRLVLALHWLLPSAMATSVCFFIEKPSSGAG